MQDKRQPDIDPGLVDRAWHDMRTQLDAVMPVEEDRRAGAWWWLLLVLLLLVGGTGLGWYGYQQDKEKEPASAPQAQREQSEPAVARLPTASAGNVSPKPKEVSPSPHGGDGRRLPGDAATEQAEPKQGVEQPSVVDASPELPNPATVLAPIETSRASAARINQMTPARSGKQVPSVAPLPMLPLEDLSASERWPITRSPEVKPLRATRLFLEAGAGVALDDPGQILGAGVGMETRLGRRWQLSLVARYQWLSRGHLDLGGGLKNAEEFDWTNGTAYPGFMAQDPILRDEYLDELDMRQVEGHLRLGWRLGPRWRVLAGVQGGYVASATAVILLPPSTTEAAGNLDVDRVGFDLYGAEFTYAPSVEASEASILEANRWRLGGSLGLGYRLARRWEVLAEYRHMLGDWPEAGVSIGANEHLQVSVRYYPW